MKFMCHVFSFLNFIKVHISYQTSHHLRPDSANCREKRINTFARPIKNFPYMVAVLLGDHGSESIASKLHLAFQYMPGPLPDQWKVLQTPLQEYLVTRVASLFFSKVDRGWIIEGTFGIIGRA